MDHVALLRATNYIRKGQPSRETALRDWKRLFALRETLYTKHANAVPAKYYGTESWKDLSEGIDSKLADLVGLFKASIGQSSRPPEVRVRDTDCIMQCDIIFSCLFTAHYMGRMGYWKDHEMQAYVSLILSPRTGSLSSTQVGNEPHARKAADAMDGKPGELAEVLRYFLNLDYSHCPRFLILKRWKRVFAVDHLLDKINIVKRESRYDALLDHVHFKLPELAERLEVANLLVPAAKRKDKAKRESEDCAVWRDHDSFYEAEFRVHYREMMSAGDS